MGDKIVAIISALLIVLIVDIILAVVLMWCWNYIMPVIFGLPKIGWWQALVMNIMTSLLFKSVNTKD